MTDQVDQISQEVNDYAEEVFTAALARRQTEQGILSVDTANRARGLPNPARTRGAGQVHAEAVADEEEAVKKYLDATRRLKEANNAH